MNSSNITDKFTVSDYQSYLFNKGMHPRISLRPMYFELGFSPSPHIYARQIVAHKIQKALTFISPDYGLLIWDIYRPRAVQSKLFNWMRDEIKKKRPHLSEDENYKEAQKYMSAPSQIGEEYCPPHLSGGAIDLTLYEIASGKELEMGTNFDDCSECAHRDYFSLKNQKHLSPKDLLIKERRNQLKFAMEQVGFTSYEYEWWHFDIGNIFWSRITGLPVRFGPLFGDEEGPNLSL